MEWFEELKRRGVYKATAVYTVVAWSLIQAIGVIAPIFNAPQWLNQTLVLILLLGFPVVLALSWMFEISSGGLRRSSSKSNSPSSSVSIKDYLVAGTISVLVLLVVGQQVLLLSRANTFESETLASSQVSEGIAQILQFIDEERFLDAFTLASSLEKDQPNNTVLQELWSEFSAVGSVISEPQGLRSGFQITFLLRVKRFFLEPLHFKMSGSPEEYLESNYEKKGFSLGLRLALTPTIALEIIRPIQTFRQYQ